MKVNEVSRDVGDIDYDYKNVILPQNQFVITPLYGHNYPNYLLLYNC